MTINRSDRTTTTEYQKRRDRTFSSLSKTQGKKRRKKSVFTKTLLYGGVTSENLNKTQTFLSPFQVKIV